MSDWRKSAQISGDVIFFQYVGSQIESQAPHVFVWDIDKTYLDTHFENLKGLWRTIFEKGVQKKNIPGTRSLLNALVTAKKDLKTPLPIYFISASPPQLEKRIVEKLRLDKIELYGAFFKDNLKNLKPKYFRRLTQQVGYKLQALLELRLRLHADVKQTFWGDDSESDAIIYNLYSDICSRRIAKDELIHVLDSFYVQKIQRKKILNLMDQVPVSDPVERIFINLANDTDTDYYIKFGRRTMPTYNTFQGAVDLLYSKHIDLEHLNLVAEDLIKNYNFTSDELSNSIDDLIDRKFFDSKFLVDTVEYLKDQGYLPSYYKVPNSMVNKLDYELDSIPWVPDRVDYLNDFR